MFYRLSNYLIAILCMAFLATAQAGTGFFGNPERDGEGIIVTVQEDILAFAFFTYWDAVSWNSIPPTVSPAPPVVGVVTPYCTSDPKIGVGVEIPPTVSPAPPIVDNEPMVFYGGRQAWFIGFGTLVDGIATGDMFYNRAIAHPYVLDPGEGLSHEFLVATFMMEARADGGFDMYLDCNDLLPNSLYMCNNVHTFTNLVVGQE